MARSRFVSPEVVRLNLADVAKASHARLVALPEPKTPDERVARKAEIVASEAHVADAIERNDFITIKKRLNTGEQRAVFARMARDITPGEKIALDPSQVGKAKIAEYLIGWSFVDEAGKPVDCTPEAIDNLDPDSYREIREAVEAHEEAIEAEIAARKNGLGSTSAGAPSSEPISLSVAP